MENKVILLGFYGGDKTHALSAWQSTGTELGVELPQDISERINTLFSATVSNKKKSYSELLEFLAVHKHHTPFEKSTLHFQVEADIASHIHFLKHRIGVSINSESQRYKELTENNYHIPSDWNYFDRKDLQEHCETCFEKYHKMIETLVSEGFSRKRAKESARYFLPYSTQLHFDAMFNFRSFMHFQGLRNSEHAQLEIREIADSMLKLVQNIPEKPFEFSLKAFGYSE